MTRWRIAALDAALHDRSDFQSGAEELDAYLARQASQDVKRDFGRAFVASPEDEPRRVMGYYTLSAAEVARELLAEDHARKTPYRRIPAALIGRLAVDQRAQGRGLGSILLMDALWRVRRASEQMGVQCVIVDARDEAAAGFYERHSFARFKDQPMRLYLPVKAIPVPL